MTSSPQPLHEHRKYPWTHFFSHRVSDTDWSVILEPYRPRKGSPERDCFCDLRRTYQNVGHWFRKLQRERNYEGRNFQLPRLHHWRCFGVTDLGRGNKFLALTFPQENEKYPHLSALLSTQYSPSFRLLVYIELPNLRIKAQSPKIKILVRSSS